MTIEIAKMFAGHEPRYFKLLQLFDVAYFTTEK
jgi:hypothetical protein